MQCSIWTSSKRGRAHAGARKPTKCHGRLSKGSLSDDRAVALWLPAVLSYGCPIPSLRVPTRSSQRMRREALQRDEDALLGPCARMNGANGVKAFR
jgi:hypothetical protein